MDGALLLTHMDDLARRAQKTGMAHSKFLTPAEAAEVAAAYQKRKDVTLALDGGFAGAERQIAVFLQPDWGVYTCGDVLAGLVLRHRQQDTIRHQDVLGAVLGLGLSRDVLGDIFIEPGKASAACLASMADFIAAELQKAGRVGVAVQRVDIAQLPALAAALSEKEVSVASLRLDAVLAAAFHCSRADACEWILSGNAQLNHRECKHTPQAVEEGAILSVLGKGRVKLLAVGSQTRKGRLKITLGYF